MKQLLENAKKNQDSFRPLPFWSWNEELEEDRLRWQVQQMAKAGLGGFFMHARVGIKTEYMGEQWFRCIKSCIDEAEKCGLEPWGYDENGYPSGIADGQVCRESENYRATWIELKKVEKPGNWENLRVVAWYTPASVRCTEEDFAGVGMVAHTKNEMRSADPMNAEAVKRFLELTHQRYRAELGDDFGKHMPGFFTDEPQLKQYQLPWSYRFDETFRKEYGYDILDVLPALKDDTISGCEAVRHDYWMLVSKLYCESFAKQIYEWCQENHCQFTGHVMGEDTLLEQMGSCAGVMPFYPYMDMPGMDWLGRRIGTPLAPKQVSSVAAQMGREKVLSETFALSGWDVSFEDLKWMAQWQYANGVNRLCPHLESYSIKGIRKRDYPASLFVQEPWWEKFSAFNDYISALGALFAQAPEACDLLVLHPLRTAYVRYNGSAKCQGVRNLDANFAAISEQLQQRQIPYHYGDEVVMRDHGKVCGNTLQVGQVSYHYVLLPQMDNILSSTLDLLEQFAANGGIIYCADKLPHLVDGRPSDRAQKLPVCAWQQTIPTQLMRVEEDGKHCADILAKVHNKDGKRIYFLFNTSRETAHTLTVTCTDTGLAQLQLPQWTAQPVKTEKMGDTVTFTCTLKPAESVILLSSQETVAADQPDVPTEDIMLPKAMRIVASDLNALTLDSCEYAVAGGEFQPEIPLIRLQKQLMDVQTDAQVALRFHFRMDMQKLPQTLYLVSENIPEFALKVNGQLVEPKAEGWYLDPDFPKVNIAPYVKNGVNEILLQGRFYQRKELYDFLYRPKDLSSNFYAVDFEFEGVTYDVELESIYLLGDFCVDSSAQYVPGRRRSLHTEGSFTLTDVRKELNTGDITTQGYPFFAGCMDLEFTVNVNKQENVKYLFGEPKPDCPAAQLFVNGQDAGMLIWAQEKPDITNLLRNGENTLTLRLYSGLRNLLGPHHYLHGESYYVGVSTFGDLPGWCEDVEGVSGNIWRDGFCFVTFGPHRDEKDTAMREYKNTRNPILPLDMHIPDAEAHVMPDGKTYIYGSLDEKEDKYCSDRYYVVSTADLKHWEIHDVSFTGQQVPWFGDENAPKYPGIDLENPTPLLRKLLAQPLPEPVIFDEENLRDKQRGKAEAEETSALLYAPDAAYRNGKYYMYFCLSDNSEGVAVSDKPMGPFTDPVQLPCGEIDPAVFVDTDGQAYYFWGQFALHGAKLNPDMVSLQEGTEVHKIITEEEHFFHEGASIRKIGDTYYLVYADMERGKPTSLGYSTAKSPFGPYTYRGIIVDNDGCDPATWNNHGSIEQINGQWYIFYHRSSRGSKIHRRLCIEPIHINPDGSIDEVKITSQGVGEPFVAGEKIWGYQACKLSGTILIDTDRAGSEWLTNISPEDAAVFRYVKTEKGFLSISIEAEGSGRADCYLSDQLVGSLTLSGEMPNIGALCDDGNGVRELKLCFTQAENLKIRAITLFE